jgi:hypothetical protein
LDKMWSDNVVSSHLSTDSQVTVDLSASPEQLLVEWFNPRTGAKTEGGTATGGAVHSFTAPFSGNAVLYLYSPLKPGNTWQHYLPLIHN